jgi:hypothetical protein
MKSTEPAAARQVPEPRTVRFGPSLQARLYPVADSHTGALTAVDFRLWRQPPGADGWATTQAGLRLPSAALREIAQHLLEMADELDV